MLIELIDGKEKLIKKLEIDFEWLMLEAEKVKGDIFHNAIKVLENKMQGEGFQIQERFYLDVQKYLQKYTALGYAKEPFKIRVQPVKGEKKSVKCAISNNFEEIVELPNKDYEKRFERLVGLDDLKGYIRKESAIIVAPEMLEAWSKKYHHTYLKVLDTFKDRYPFFIFEGDVGTGKTEFAMTFGNDLAKFIKKQVLLARMSMKSRGNGVVGEMSKLISKAFQEASELANANKTPVILLLDEADSLAQSREGEQMHHEDRAGVNALIQGIDHVRYSSVPVLVVFCTNRIGSIDPAIKRRAALIHRFNRPNFEQRLDLFQKYFPDINLSLTELNTLAQLTGENEKRPFGFTYSDLITKVLPQSVLTAYPNKVLSFEIIREVLRYIKPTTPFNEYARKE
ncbi:ATP-binding protein [Bacillus pacificus]|uniref:ATP-binding protein n=1 Tax=Bacillus pacificus TaxID=2026187 RepID=UPI0022B69B63|nr:AAA family ATPase [Bacillus pacificus]MCZ7519746.1 ATP-binding protein [Bacillus pacificus]